jgi:hypothetical protein
MTTLTTKEAINLLIAQPQNYATPEKVWALVTPIAVDSNGLVGVLYSGEVGNGYSFSRIVEAMIGQQENIKLINTTQVADFIKSNTFGNAVAQAFNTEVGCRIGRCA